MEQNIRIENCQINEEQRTLRLEIGGTWPSPVPGGRLRLSAVFEGDHADRYYPVIARCEQNQEGGAAIRADVLIQLEYVFYQYRREGEETISLRFAYCDLKETWVFFQEQLTLPAALFEQRKQSAGRWETLGRRMRYAACTLLLPVWLLDGWLTLRRGRPLHPAAREMQGRKAILYHAHGLVKDWTGYGYSMRETKTNYFCRQYERACRKIPQTEGILFLSERRVEDGGNLDVVKKRLQREGVGPVSEFLTTRPVHKLTWKELRRSARLLAGARVVVLEDFYPQLHALLLRRDTDVLQLWHACGAFKLFGLSELGLVPHLEQSTSNHRSYTAALASGRAIVPFYSEAYGVSRQCIRPVGVPRTDIFFDQDYRDRMRKKLWEKYPVCAGKQVVLYAPTFRGSGNKTAYFPAERFPVGRVLEHLPEQTVLIIKNHPFVKEQWTVEEKYRERVLDLSETENINDLLFITSVLVTDYSSVIFEAALLRIPMVFYAFDLPEYLEERSLYFDFASFAPGPIVGTDGELTAAVSQRLADSQVDGEVYEEFCRFFLDALDGRSTERTVQLIRELLSGGAR